jgi:hypothetical protein
VHAPVVAGSCVRARTLLAPSSETPEERNLAKILIVPKQEIKACMPPDKMTFSRQLLCRKHLQKSPILLFRCAGSSTMHLYGLPSGSACRCEGDAELETGLERLVEEAAGR